MRIFNDLIDPTMPGQSADEIRRQGEDRHLRRRLRLDDETLRDIGLDPRTR